MSRACDRPLNAGALRRRLRRGVRPASAVTQSSDEGPWDQRSSPQHRVPFPDRSTVRHSSRDRRRCRGHAVPPVDADKLRPLPFKLSKGRISSSEQQSNSVADPPSNRHSLTMSNFGTVSETATGENVARITIGRWSNMSASSRERNPPIRPSYAWGASSRARILLPSTRVTGGLRMT
jgi:hypothetical protein